MNCEIAIESDGLVEESIENTTERSITEFGNCVLHEYFFLH